MASIGRNDPCPCGSGKKAKRCCYQAAANATSAGDGIGASGPDGQNKVARAAGNAEAHFGQAAALMAHGRAAEAVPHLEHALSSRPKYAEAHMMLGQALWAQGKLAAAAASLEQGLALMPKLAEAHSNLGLLYGALGKHDAAVASFRKAIALKPEFAWAHCNLGNVLHAQGNLPAAVASYRRALAIEPELVEAWVNLGNTLVTLGDVDAAVTCFRKALALKPDHALAWLNISAPLQAQGDLDSAIDSLRKALSLAPALTDARSALLFAMSYHPGCPPALRLAEARRYGAAVTAHARPYERWRVDVDAPGAGRPLRVGLVSADLRSHPVAYFVEGILAHLDPARVELVAFAAVAQEDETTARLKPRFAAWNGIAELDDAAAAARIHAAGIHVLVDLGGHTAHNRLPVFAWKPAPVQTSWLGYFATTGVPAIDYLLADPVSAPDSIRDQFTETVWHLPDTRLCFAAPAGSERLQPVPLPAAGNGYVTFGCFQNPLKLSDATLSAWGRILAALPGARLRLQGSQMRFAAARARLLGRFARFGIEAGRVMLAEQVPREDYLAAHAGVDLILDTFPYPGGTTTCEALWMGVPTLTLAGDTLVSRQGASLLACAGLGDWIAADEDDYVARALAHAADTAGLARLRSSLRATVLASPLFDAPRFARNLEAALHGMWEQNRNRLSAR
jgi:protein O-GlcNAc transferase